MKKIRHIYFVAMLVIIINFIIQPVLAKRTDLNLQDCIELALSNNPALKSIEADYTDAKWRVAEANSGRLPEFTYSFTGSRFKDDTVTATTDRFENELSLSIPLYTGGRVAGLIEQAELNLKSTELELTKAKQQLTFDVTTAYFNVLQTKSALAVIEESVGRVNEHLKQVQLRYQLGNAAKIDQIRVEVEMINIEQDRIKAKKDYEIAIANLNNLLGRPFSDLVMINDTLTLEKLPLSPEQYLSQAELSRPEIIQADLEFKIAEKNLRISQSNIYPSLSLNGISGSNGSDFPGNSNNTWSVSLTADWRLFDFGKTNAQINQAKSGIVKAQANLEKVRQGVRLEVYQSFLELLAAEKMIETSQTALAKAEEEYKIAQIGYEKGFETNLNVLSYQVALSQAKTNYLTALYNYNVGKARFFKNVGIL